MPVGNWKLLMIFGLGMAFQGFAFGFVLGLAVHSQSHTTIEYLAAVLELGFVLSVLGFGWHLRRLA